MAPLRPRNWSYRSVLTFITLTAPPALLYAIPVERFMSVAGARTANVWFLALIAGWRVALYANFLRRTAGLSSSAVVVGTVLPLALIVVMLSMANLEHVVFNVMAGLGEDQTSANDDAYGVVVFLSVLSVPAAPIMLIAYAVLVNRAGRRSRPVEHQAR